MKVIPHRNIIARRSVLSDNKKTRKTCKKMRKVVTRELVKMARQGHKQRNIFFMDGWKDNSASVITKELREAGYNVTQISGGWRVSLGEKDK